MATPFNNLNNEQKGDVIRYMINNPAQARQANETVDFTNILTKANVNVRDIPAQGVLNAFKNTLAQRGFVDGLFQNVAGIGDTQLSLSLAGAGAAGTQLSGQLLQAETSRDLGLAQQQLNRQKVESAILAPSDYIKNKNRDLDRIDQQSLTVFNQSFSKYLNDYRFPRDKAKDKAMSDARIYKQILMKQHNIQFPAELLKQAKSRIQQNV